MSIRTPGIDRVQTPHERVEDEVFGSFGLVELRATGARDGREDEQSLFGADALPTSRRRFNRWSELDGHEKLLRYLDWPLYFVVEFADEK